ncbi:MAG TPA: DEAD/DEAH box helicase [Coriobacteriia bacterium]|nr:DEAD/DEAH box helicase [Coriobacteriia bacterium]
MTFESLGLEPRLLAGVDALGYTTPSPIQAEAIPHVLAGRDVVGVAQTGTGKTAAFVLPTLQRTPKHKGVRALIVTPTRELALQIGEVIKGASVQTRHKSAVVFGGVGIQPQIQKMRRGVDILVACPGRLLDLVNRRAVDLSSVEILVLDEADRMLDMGFWPDVHRIINLCPEPRQNLLFSATMDPAVIKIVDSILDNPVRVEVTPPTQPVDRIAQSLYPVAREQKTDLLLGLLAEGEHTRTLVFTRTKHRADRLAKQLSRAGVNSSAIHGGRSQSQRQTALEGFKRGRHDVLIATDVASRGIDVNDISHVVNYDMPNTPEDYVHRIGRTARAGASGTAISFVDETEHDTLRDIERILGLPIVCEDLDGFDYHPARIVPDPERTVTNPQRGGRGGQGGNGTGGSGRNGKGHRGSRRGGKGRAGSAGGSSSGNGNGDGSSRSGAGRSSSPASASSQSANGGSQGASRSTGGSSEGSQGAAAKRTGGTRFERIKREGGNLGGGSKGGNGSTTSAADASRHVRRRRPMTGSSN